MFFLQVVKEALEVRASKVGHCTQTSEEGLVGDLLEVTLTDVLHRREKSGDINVTQHLSRRIKHFFILMCPSGRV